MIRFRELLGADPVVITAPACINLFGEHMGINDGLALSAAVNKYVQMAISKRDDDQVRLYSIQFDEHLDIRLDEIMPHGKSHGWPDFILGVVDQFLKKGHRLTGFNAVVSGDIPLSGGLSSSAAIASATILALSEIFDIKLSKLSMALIAQASCDNFAGTPGDITDSFAAIFGKKGFAIKLDSKSCKHEYVPLQTNGYAIVLFDSGILHNPGGKRRGEWEAAMEIIKKCEPVASLADVTLPMLSRYIEDPGIRKHCGYILREKARLIAACEDLRIGDIESFGKKLLETHDSIIRDYGSSYHELDFLVDTVRGHPAVAGARMIGEGLSGCTVNLVRHEAVEELTEKTSEAYAKIMGKKLTTLAVETSGAALVITNHQATTCN